MTVTILQETIGKYHVEIAQDKYESGYKVVIAEERGALYWTINSHYYPTLQQAKRRFSYLKRKARG